MLKGITPQLSSMNGYISSLLAEHGEQTWQGYLLNTQKNTFELLKLVKIILNDVTDHLPRGMKQEFQKSCNLLKEYFKRKPKGDLDNEEHEKSYQMDYDEVQQYLDNKPEIVTNDEERGELFKFLTMNQQKEKNNQMILESMPRYSFDYSSRFPAVHKTKHAHTIEYGKEDTCIELHKSPLRNSGTLRGSTRISHEEHKKTVEVSENQAQTDLTLTVIKEMIECYANANLGAQKVKETCDFATEMSDFIQEVRTNTVRKGTKTKEKEKSSEKDGEIVKEKKPKNARVSQEKMITGTDHKENTTAAVSKKEIRPSAVVTSHKIPSKDETAEHTQKVISKPKPKQLKRQSTNSLISSSRKQIISNTSTKKITNRLSRDMKEGSKPINNSKFSKEKKPISNFNECTTIMETNQDLTVSNNFEETNKAEKMKEEEGRQKEILIIEENDKIVETNTEENDKMVEQIAKLQEINRDSMASSAEESKNEDKQMESALLTAIKKHENHLQKKMSRRQSQKSGSRQKIPSNKQPMTHSNYLVQQAYSSTFGHPFYRKNSKKNETTDNTSLPKIQEKVTKVIKNDRTESFKKRNFETSPYARVLAQGLDQRTLKYTNSLSQFNNRSLHLNPIQQPLLSPKDFNRSQFPQSSQKGENQRSPYSFRFQNQLNPFLSQAERQLMLQEQHNKLIKEIQENTATKRSKDPKWTTILKGIRHYQLMHASLCGQNCIHLNKFYDFLKRKNLSMYINRKQLLLHKKNIQINTNF